MRNKKIIAIAALEFLFFLLLMIDALVAVTSVSGNVNELRTFQQEFVVDENVSPNYLYESLVSLSNILDEVFKAAIIAFVFLFLLAGFFCGVLWKWSFNLINKKPLLKDYDWKYFLKFYLLTLIWFLIFAGMFYLLYQYGFSYGLFAAILILFFYFAWVNFSCFVFDNKVLRSFINGIKLAVLRFYIFVPTFLIFFIILSVFSYLFGLIDYGIISVVASVVVVFLFVWFRIFLILICGEQDSNLRRH